MCETKTNTPTQMCFQAFSVRRNENDLHRKYMLLGLLIKNASPLLLLLLLLLLLKEVGSARLRESGINPISPKTPAPQYPPIDRKKRKGKK